MKSPIKVNLSVVSRKRLLFGGASCLLVGIAMLGAAGLQSTLAPVAVLVGSFSLCVGAVSSRNLSV
jgi:hypothetical protein